MLHGVMNTGYLPAVFTMQLPVSAKPARYRIQLEKRARPHKQDVVQIAIEVFSGRTIPGADDLSHAIGKQAESKMGNGVDQAKPRLSGYTYSDDISNRLWHIVCLQVH